MFLKIPKIDFTCPKCNKSYSDPNDIYLNRINKNQSGITRIQCDCGYKFGATYDYMGNAVSFELKKVNNHENNRLKNWQ